MIYGSKQLSDYMPTVLGLLIGLIIFLAGVWAVRHQQAYVQAHGNLLESSLLLPNSPYSLVHIVSPK